MTDPPETSRNVRLAVAEGITLVTSIELKVSGPVIPRPRPPRRLADLVIVLGETADGHPVEATVRLELVE